jgi:hypothetical protein
VERAQQWRKPNRRHGISGKKYRSAITKWSAGIEKMAMGTANIAPTLIWYLNHLPDVVSVESPQDTQQIIKIAGTVKNTPEISQKD